MLRPWWTRVWTLQEYVVPKKFRFYCGKESIDREELNQAMSSISHCRRVDETLILHKAFEAAWIRRRVLNWYQGGIPMQLTAVMAYISDYKGGCSDLSFPILVSVATGRYDPSRSDCLKNSDQISQSFKKAQTPNAPEIFR